jgi:UDP-glucose 4-epimerase
LAAALRSTGRAEMYERVAGPLVADPAALMALGWRPPMTSAAALAALTRS